MHISKRRFRPRAKPEGESLNIVPYLDILMNLVIFMLLSMTGFVTYGVLNVASPRYGGGGASASSSGQSDKPNLLLTVLVSEKGFFVAGAGAVLGGDDASGSGESADSDKSKPTVPVLDNGKYDYAALTSIMCKIKKEFASESKIIIGADPLIPYETLVKTMDACRVKNKTPACQDLKAGTLFSQVSLTVM